MWRRTVSIHRASSYEPAAPPAAARGQEPPQELREVAEFGASCARHRKPAAPLARLRADCAPVGRTLRSSLDLLAWLPAMSWQISLRLKREQWSGVAPPGGRLGQWF